MAVTLSEVTKLYVATFNRAPDAAGINYWANSGMPIENIAQSFFDQPETQTLYPSGTTNSSFVNSVYDNLFNRTPDTAGFNYWVQELNNGTISKQNFILAVINGALGDDATILTNKQTVGLDFVAKGLDDVTLARSVMANVDSTQTSVTNALDLIDSATSSPETSGIQLISTSLTGESGNGYSSNPSISADGRYVAFQSSASNLVSGDANNLYDIFIKDTQTGAITLVSVNSSGVQGNGYSYNASISADGRYVAFQSSAPNLISGDSYGSDDIFIKDMLTGAITLVSSNSSGGKGNGSSLDPSISADGRYVAFQSSASNLRSGDSYYGYDNIFIKDTQTGAIALVSASSSGVVGGSSSMNPSISADGRYVAFESDSAYLVSGDTNYRTDIFIKDTQTGAITLVSNSSSSVQGDGDSYNASISADGRYVAFQSRSNNLVSGDTNFMPEIFIKDTQTGTLTLVSSSSSGVQGRNTSSNPSISADGRYVTFWSYASNLVSGDTNGKADIFIKDTQTGAIALASTSSNGLQGDFDSRNPSISSDGKYVAFFSGANLVDGDTNVYYDDIYLVGVNDLF